MIEIKELYLENWKSHEKSLITFGKVNLIIGKMGSGKTSITDAICYSFFGNFSDLNSKKIKLEDIISRKPKEKDYSKVILKFSFNEKNYEIYRIIERGKGSYAELRENNRVIVSGTTDVNKFIEKLTKSNFQTFVAVNYAEQNNMEFFLNLERGERKSKFDQMIGIEKMERIRKTCVSLKNRLAEIHREKERFLSQLLQEKIDEKLRNVKIEIENNQKRLIELQNERDIILDRLKIIQEKYERSKKLKLFAEEIEKEILSIESKISSIEKIIEEILKEVQSFSEEEINNIVSEFVNKIDIKKSELLQIENNSKIFEKQKEDLNKKIAETNFKLDRKRKIEKEIEDIIQNEKRFSSILEEKEKLKNEEQKLSNELIELEIENKKIENILKVLDEEFSVCPICKSEISKNKKDHIKQEYENLKKELKEKAEKTLKELAEVKNKLKNIELEESKAKYYLAKKDELIKELEGLNVNESDLEKFLKELEEINKKIDEIKLKKESYNREILELESKLKEYKKLQEKVKRKRELENELEQARKNLEEKKIKLEEIKNDDDYKNIQIYENMLIELKAYSEKINSEINYISNTLKILEARKKELEDRLNYLEKLKREKENLEKIIKDLAILEQAIVESQILVRNMLIDAINYYLSLYWKSLYPYEDYIDAKLVVSEDDYILQIKDSYGRWIDLEKVASGGERTLAAICLRIAFSKVLSPLMNILILDEPTHNLDENAISRLAKIINESLPEIFDQIFIITHDERFKSIVNANIIKVERDKMQDLPSKVILEE
ncbi:MAG: SMC family ATPase [Candidatus Aenigmatarchaeota archaeon]